MPGTLVVADVLDGQVQESTRGLIGAATTLGGPVTLGIAAPKAGDLVAAAAAAGVDRVVTAELPFDEYDPDTLRSAVAAMVEESSPDVVVLGYSIRSASFAAALAERAGFGFAADVVALSRDDAGGLVAVKPVYGGKVYAELGFEPGHPVVVMVRPNTFDAAEDGPAPTEVVRAEVTPSSPRVRHVEYHQPESSGVDLRRADVIVAVGRGVGGKENIPVFAELARALGAELGASRPVVDAGWLPPAHQVGQTGLTVKPKVYVAFGISGALQHMAGMHASKTIVAVNTDESAPIFNVADVGAVADVHEVAAEIQALLARDGA